MACVSRKVALFAALFVVFLHISTTTFANQPSQTSVQYAEAIAKACAKNWDTKVCASTVADSNKVLAANYIAALKEKGKTVAAEKVKEECAASTATKGKKYPANVVASAFAQCANQISDTVDQTGINPDISHYQLLIIPTLCLSNDPRCKMAASQLQKFR